jgi:hypothetical protein
MNFLESKLGSLMNCLIFAQMSFEQGLPIQDFDVKYIPNPDVLEPGGVK